MRWADATAVATQTPPDLAGCCVLDACAGGRAVVQDRSGGREPVNVYLLPVLPPGSRKSAVIGAATRPLYAAEEAGRDDAVAGRDAITERDIAVKAAEKARKDAANATDPAKRPS